MPQEKGWSAASPTCNCCCSKLSPLCGVASQQPGHSDPRLSPAASQPAYQVHDSATPDSRCLLVCLSMCAGPRQWWPLQDCFLPGPCTPNSSLVQLMQQLAPSNAAHYTKSRTAPQFLGKPCCCGRSSKLFLDGTGYAEGMRHGVSNTGTGIAFLWGTGRQVRRCGR